MSTQYTTEPPSTATVLLHTTAGPLTISLFASQTPLTCRNFLQHCLDGYYNGVIFHRVAPGFVIQTGDPSGTGEGGQSIYEDREFETLDSDWAKLLRTDEGLPVKFGDEFHSRLKFNRRGLVGMAKGTGESGSYGSQFFITLGDTRAELDGKCTMFGRVEGDGIYSVVKIAEGELNEGSERPLYPEKILSAEVVARPSGDAWQKISKRTRVAARFEQKRESVKKKQTKKKGGKALLSFGGEEGEEGGNQLLKAKKAKFNTALIDGNDTQVEVKQRHVAAGTSDHPVAHKSTLEAAKVVSATSVPPSPIQKRKAEAQLGRSPSPKRRKPSFHESTTQLPLRNPEVPSRSPTPNSSPREHGENTRPGGHGKGWKASQSNILAEEIAALKASLRRDVTTVAQPVKKKSALESLIPATSTRGRRRPRAGEINSKDDARSMNVLDAFRARLEGASSAANKSTTSSEKKTTINGGSKMDATQTKNKVEDNNEGEDNNDQDEDEDEAKLCDLHFIANCRSCFASDLDLDISTTSQNPTTTISGKKDVDDRDDFLSHSLTFEKDRLGKDLTWKKKNEEDLVVIDPRERERELGLKNKNKQKTTTMTKHNGFRDGGAREFRDKK